MSLPMLSTRLSGRGDVTTGAADDDDDAAALDIDDKSMSSASAPRLRLARLRERFVERFFRRLVSVTPMLPKAAATRGLG
jgi:hypothetical protein